MSGYITGMKVPLGCITMAQVEEVAATAGGAVLETTVPAPWYGNAVGGVRINLSMDAFDAEKVVPNSGRVVKWGGWSVAK